MKNQNKIALVTGASGGIGLEFVKQIAAKSIDMVLVSRNRVKLEKVKEEIEGAFKVRCYVIASDLSETESCEQIFQYCLEHKLDIDILINNAGAGSFVQSIEHPPQAVNDLLTLNMLSLTNLCNLFGKEMVNRGSGFILNVASLAGKNAIPFFASYSASKAYVIHYSIALRNELKSSGVNVTCLLPGFVRTNFDASSHITNQSYMEMSYKSGMNPDKVAAVGIKALFKKKAVVTAGITNKVSGFFSSILPKTLTAALMKSYLAKYLK